MKDDEEVFIETVRAMLARPDYLLPLSAAERQFRDHYYGLNAAALLEDLFFDALGNFIRQTTPSNHLLRIAEEEGMMTPFPTWFWPYAEERPPDMYASQRREYDNLFGSSHALRYESHQRRSE